MKYTKEERLEIGRRIYSGELSRYEAGEQYGISPSTARDYMRLYRDAYSLPAKRGTPKSSYPATNPAVTPVTGLEEIQAMSRDGVERFVELGPKKTLVSFVKKIDKAASTANVEDLASLESAQG